MQLDRFISDLSERRLAVGASLVAAGSGLEAALMIHRLLWMRGLGPICGVHPATLHCTGCYAAMVLAAAGALMAAIPPLKTARLR